MHSWISTARLSGSRGFRRVPFLLKRNRRSVHLSTCPIPELARLHLMLAPPPQCREQPDCMTAQQARAIAGTAGPVRFLSFPPSMGYDQNPIAVYYCYGPGAATRCLLRSSWETAFRGSLRAACRSACRSGVFSGSPGAAGPGALPQMCVAAVTNTPWGCASSCSPPLSHSNALLRSVQ